MTSPKVLNGIVKQVLCGDTVVIKYLSENGRFNEKTLLLMGIRAPKFRYMFLENVYFEEPYGYEAREYIRKQLIGKMVAFVTKPSPDPAAGGDALSNCVEEGRIFFPTDVDIVEEMILEGLVKVKSDPNANVQQSSSSRNLFEVSVDTAKLMELEKIAQDYHLGVWSPNAKEHVQNIKCLYVLELENKVKTLSNSKQPAIIENIQASNEGFVFEVYMISYSYYFSMQLSGILISQDEDLKEKAKLFLESRVLQRSGIKVVLESSTKQFIIGSILLAEENLAELLLNAGCGTLDSRSVSQINSQPNTKVERTADTLRMDLLDKLYDEQLEKLCAAMEEIGGLKSNLISHRRSIGLLLARNVLETFAKKILRPFVDKEICSATSIENAYKKFLSYEHHNENNKKIREEILTFLITHEMTEENFVKRITTIYRFCSRFIHAFSDEFKTNSGETDLIISVAPELSDTDQHVIRVLSNCMKQHLFL